MSRVISSPVGIRQVSYVLCSMTGPSADPMISTCQDRSLRAERPALVIARGHAVGITSPTRSPQSLCADLCQQLLTGSDQDFGRVPHGSRGGRM